MTQTPMRLRIIERLLLTAGIFLGVALATLPVWAQITPFKVIDVADGDTITVLDESNTSYRIRLANIDAPETGGGRCRPTQPWATQSKNALTRMVKGRQVGLACTEIDRYGRQICDVLVDGTTANRALVESGLAWANRANPRYLRDQEVAAAESRAQRARVGLWSAPGQTPPWEWRKTQWNQGDGCAR